MKHKYGYGLLIALLVCSMFGCDKVTVSIPLSASLNIINATVNLGGIKANFTNGSKIGYEYYSQITTTIGYGGYANFPTLAEAKLPLSIVSLADTVHPVFASTLSFPDKASYSLYLSGLAGAVDTIFLQDIIPVYTDSLCGIRFINLSPNSQPVNITLVSSPSVYEFSNLGYKQITVFKTYPAKSSNLSYVFQIRNASNDSLLNQYTLSTPFFHNTTLALIGLEGSFPSLNIARINNYY